jgi:hypothetical protein
MKQSNLSLNFAKLTKSPPRVVLDGVFATVAAVCYSSRGFVFSFFIYFV